MTDNEKRAHDLAIMLTSKILNPEFLMNEPKEADGKTINVDPYQKYKQIYDAALKSLNADYPDAQ